jgi:hypothetical protein
MKIKGFLSLTLVLFAFFSFGVKAENEGEIIVKCPEGDKYKCYSEDGIMVYKGEGITEIIIPIP